MRYSFQNNINAYLGKDSRLSLRLNVQLRKTKQPNISMNDLFGELSIQVRWKLRSISLTTVLLHISSGV